MSAEMFSFAGDISHLEVAGATSGLAQGIGQNFVDGMHTESSSMSASNATLPEMATEGIGRF
ncbi:MAG: hypothetical protein AB7L92_01225 [Alphaproteobacteria bacterium]